MNNLKLNKEAKDLINAINIFMSASAKKEYNFSDDEKTLLTQMIDILKNHIRLLIEYEEKNKDK
jgi:hypothetical protein